MVLERMFLEGVWSGGEGVRHLENQSFFSDHNLHDLQRSEVLQVVACLVVIR